MDTFLKIIITYHNYHYDLFIYSRLNCKILVKCNYNNIQLTEINYLVHKNPNMELLSHKILNLTLRQHPSTNHFCELLPGFIRKPPLAAKCPVHVMPQFHKFCHILQNNFQTLETVSSFKYDNFVTFDIAALLSISA